MKISAPSNPAPPIESFGGIEGIRVVLTSFYKKVFLDPMIGYLFREQSMAQLIDRETQWTAKSLGINIEYEGQSLATAHQKHPIRHGHFHRRNQLLLQAIQQHQLPQECVQWWMNHSEAMQKAILGRAHQDPSCEKTSNTHSHEKNKLWRTP